MSACDHFRQHLESALAGPTDRDALRALGWHEHLFTCGECRALLEGEEALELLLDALPEVSLPSDLAARVLARLRAVVADESDTALDRLLSRDPRPSPPAGLGGRVQRAVRARREDEALERLLQRVPAEAAPPDLAPRVLAALEPQRVARTERVALRLRRSHAVAAAALALVALGAWLLGGGPAGDPAGSEREELASTADVDPELLASLDVLENWELLMSDDVDVVLGGLSVVDAEAMLEEVPAGAPQPAGAAQPAGALREEQR